MLFTERNFSLCPSSAKGVPVEKGGYLFPKLVKLIRKNISYSHSLEVELELEKLREKFMPVWAPNTVNLYCDNPEAGMWEPMQRGQMIVDAAAGTVQVIHALLPHFSRYALGAE